VERQRVGAAAHGERWPRGQAEVRVHDIEPLAVEAPAQRERRAR